MRQHSIYSPSTGAINSQQSKLCTNKTRKKVALNELNLIVLMRPPSTLSYSLEPFLAKISLKESHSVMPSASFSSPQPSQYRHHLHFLVNISSLSLFLSFLLANTILFCGVSSSAAYGTIAPPSRPPFSNVQNIVHRTSFHPTSSSPSSPSSVVSNNKSSSTMYFESNNANFSINPTESSNLSPPPTTKFQTSSSWKANFHLAPPASSESPASTKNGFMSTAGSQHPATVHHQKSRQKYSNSSLLPSAAQQVSHLPISKDRPPPFRSALSNSLLQEDQSYDGLVQPADHFTNPFYMSSQMVDPLLDQGLQDPYQGGHPILMDFMHMKTPEDASLLYQTPHSVTSPGQQSFFGYTATEDLSNPAHENFAVTETDQEIYHKSPGYTSTKHTSPLGGEGAKRPVAQNMLFISPDTKYQSYYTPFKVNTINVYAKYLTHGNGGYGKGSKCKKGKSDEDDEDELSMEDVHDAVNDAAKTVKWYQKTVTSNAVATKRRSPYIPAGVLDSKMFEYASASLKNRKCFTKMDVITILPKIDVSSMVSRYSMPACQQPQKIKCDPKAKYRSIDGSCNNIKMKTWGKSFTCHRRLLPPDYADGISAPKIAYDGGKLPNARILSTVLFPDIHVTDHKLTSMVMAFGQFIIHDITRTLPTSNDIRCCPSKTAKHPECMAIDIIEYDDVLVKAYNQTCINFVRSVSCNPCSLGPREQQNQATHTFDMSHQYGLRLNDSLALRTRRGGKLRSSSTSTYPKEELPPKMTREDPSCNVRPVPPRFKCFETADGVRASQHPALQSLHTAFHRRHNAHTDVLAKINPHWDDEKLYQEAKRITTAEQSMMIYGEYLPAIFGKKLVKHFRLGINYKGYTKYDDKLNPATIQEFIVASARFGHSQINEEFRVLFKDKKMSYSYNLRDNFFETTIVSLGHSGGVLKGISVDSQEAVDPYFVDVVKNSLYHMRKEKIGRDLPAFNIQRSRDHGIPGYVFYLDFCFGFKVKGWNDLVTFIPKKQLKKIQSLYKHWKDVDLFVGGISERLIAGAAFGPTFACINGIQFYNFKYGDRFFFEHGYQAGSFTPAQLDNIKKTVSLSSLICKTHPEVGHMPENPFIRSSGDYNKYKPCSHFPEINYMLWADKKRGPSYKPKHVTSGYGSGGGHKKKNYNGQYKMGSHYSKKPYKKSKNSKSYKSNYESYSVDKPVSKKYSKERKFEEEGPTEDFDDFEDTAPHTSIFQEHSHGPQSHLSQLINPEMAALANSPLEPIVSVPIPMSSGPETLNLVPPPQFSQPTLPKKGKPLIIHH